MKKTKARGGEIPGVQWPEPAAPLPASSQIINPAPAPERCVNCGKCPRCGR